MTDDDNAPTPGTPGTSGVPLIGGRARQGEVQAGREDHAGYPANEQENAGGALATNDRPRCDMPVAPSEADRLQQETEGSSAPRSEPAFNLPSSLVWILGILVVIHTVRTYFLSVEIDDELIFNFAFLPARYDHPLADQGLAWLWTPVTYSFLHGSWEHLIFNAFWMLAFGAPVVRRIGTGRLAIFWCLAAAAAVGLHLALHWGDMTVVIGASGVVAGLMGAAARFVFSPSGRISRQFAHRNPRLGIAEALTNRSVLFFAGVWFATNLLIGLGLFTLDGGAGIAWEAHIGGFLFGFLFFGLIDPPARQDERILED